MPGLDQRLEAVIGQAPSNRHGRHDQQPEQLFVQGKPDAGAPTGDQEADPLGQAGEQLAAIPPVCLPERFIPLGGIVRQGHIARPQGMVDKAIGHLGGVPRDAFHGWLVFNRR